MRTITSAFPWTQVKWRSKEEQRIQTLDLALKILVPLILSACLVVSLKVGSFNGYLDLLSRQSFGSPLMALGAGFTLAYLAFQLVRTVLWLRYKSYPLPPGQLPRVTVIIPAYNEGAMVEKSIYAAVASDYPADRLEIICIDDGSKDDTWEYIDRARRRYPKLIKAIRFPKNRGKKEGLYAGFIRGKGEYFVTIDSDSVITPDTVNRSSPPCSTTLRSARWRATSRSITAAAASWPGCWRCGSSWPSISSGPPKACTAASPAPPGPCPLTGPTPLNPC